MTSPVAVMKRPSWVKEVDQPTVEIDWNNIGAYDGTDVMWEKGYAKAVDPQNPPTPESPGYPAMRGHLPKVCRFLPGEVYSEFNGA